MHFPLALKPTKPLEFDIIDAACQLRYMRPNYGTFLYWRDVVASYGLTLPSYDEWLKWLFRYADC
jgi:hypothetical protein